MFDGRNLWLSMAPAAGFAGLPQTNGQQCRPQLANMSAGQHGIFFYGGSTTIAQISDGTSNTYLCGEKYIDANHYFDGQDCGR